MNHCCVSLHTWADVCKILLGQRAWNSVISLDVTKGSPPGAVPLYDLCPCDCVGVSGPPSLGGALRPSSSPDSLGHPYLQVSPVSTPSQGLVSAILPAEARGRFSIKVPWLLIAGITGGGDPKPFNRDSGGPAPQTLPITPSLPPNLEAPGPYPRTSASAPALPVFSG